MTNHPSNSNIFTHEEWNKLVEEVHERVKELARLKGGEYSGDVDRLANFRRNALDTETTKEHVWRIYAGKHWDAVTQYINDEKAGKDRKRLESIEDRALDLIVYLMLFMAMVRESKRQVKITPSFSTPQASPFPIMPTGRLSKDYD